MDAPRAGIGRITAAVVAMAATLPYLTIKILWLTGDTVGVTAPSLMNSATMVGLNAMTFGMDVVGLLLALAFTMRWGMRLPAWLVLLPIWVGIGLLSQILVSLAVTLLLEGAGAFGNEFLAGWVYLVVYGGFSLQGVGLIVAFSLYARERWPWVFRSGAARTAVPFQHVVGRGSLLVAAVVGGANLYWALGGTAGLDPAVVAARTMAGGIAQTFTGVLAIAGALAYLSLLRGSAPWAVVLSWLGSGSLFGWGLYKMIIIVTAGPLRATVPMVATDLVDLFSLLTGMVLGMAGAFLLIERSGGGVQPVQHPLEGPQREGDRETADSGHR
ncbi:hypothetical protein GCM10010404_65280 [Nonomuraea africana]|uniref:Uncharacterized protein n=1 Tax=Nonomuraea africana TaxID=46171 RepID=A0ABR9KXX4_9ACTN|nr:hypothetical protein [Nonomuraea africana]MBE1566458.1 hypothetical protein [Nonomuraea africana]